MKKIYSNLNKWAFWVCLFTSIGLGIAGFVVPPTGVVDGSVLTLIGIIFGFATLDTVRVAVARGSDMSVKKGDLEMSINNNDPEE